MTIVNRSLEVAGQRNSFPQNSDWEVKFKETRSIRFCWLSIPIQAMSPSTLAVGIVDPIHASLTYAPRQRSTIT
ncbi:MAG: hypothetical protein ACR2LM_17250 [Pyrinomonadaceae bacterium]